MKVTRRGPVAATALLLLGAVSFGPAAASASASGAQNGIVTDVASTATPRVIGGQCYGGLANGTLCRKISSMVKIGNWIYAGGIIDVVGDNNGGNERSGFSNLMRFDATTQALDPTFKPQLYRTAGTVSDGAVDGLAASTDGSTLYVGGEFSTASSGPGAPGVVRKGVAAFTAATGALKTTFTPTVCSGGGPCGVYDLRVIGSSLWIGGDFTKIAGQSRGALASLDPVSGALTSAVTIPFSGRAVPTTATKIIKIKANPAGTKAVILGNFTVAGGQTREEVAMLNVDAASGAATSVASWYSPTAFHQAVVSCSTKHHWPRDIDWSPTGDTFVIVGTGGGHAHPYPAPCDAFTKWADNNSSTAVPVLYNHTNIDTIGSVCNIGAYSYVGGHFKNLNQEVRRNGVKITPPAGTANEVHYGFGVIDNSSGLAVSNWNHSDQTGRGEGWLSVLCVPGSAATGGGVYYGGDSIGVNGNPQVQRLAYFAARS